MKYKFVESLRFVALLACVGVIAPTLLSAQVASIRRLSIAEDGSEADGASDSPALSSDASIVAFRSGATNLLLEGPVPSNKQVYRLDRSKGALSLISQNSNGAPGDNDSGVSEDDRRVLQISSDGTYLVFGSDAENLNDFDGNDLRDVFIYSDLDKSLDRASVFSSAGSADAVCESPVVIDDGSKVYFSTAATNLDFGDSNGFEDVYRRRVADFQTEQVTRVSRFVETNGASYDAAVSVDGSDLVFVSQASNFVAGDNNGVADIFLIDTTAEEGATRVSTSTGGAEGNGPSTQPQITGDGRYVVFQSDASNLVSGDTNGVTDIFFRDTITGETTLISKNFNGGPANGASLYPSVSDDGRYVAFISSATNLIQRDGNGVVDAFLCDRLLSTITRINMTPAGRAGAADIKEVVLSRNARYAAFSTDDGSLVEGDSNGLSDIFLVEPSKVLTPDTQIDAPPEITVMENQITVVALSFKKAMRRKAENAARALEENAAKKTPKPALQVRYRFEVVKLGTTPRTIRNVVSKKNSHTFKKLPSGSYSTKYKVVAMRGNRRVFSTASSPSASFEIQ